MNRLKLLTNIYRTDLIPANGSMPTTVSWRPLDLVALGLSLLSL